MKKLFITAVIAALAFSSVAQAELQISGNVTSMVAYQHDDKDAAASTGTGGLTQGDLGFININGANVDHFGFVVPQAELDVENEFGENIMARFDVDFFDLGTPSASGTLLEQAYVTANLPAGNGWELLVGKFNAPIGLESVDRHENVFSTVTPGWQYLQPTQVMGAKLYTDFNDTWNMDFALVDSFNAGNAGNSAMPSGLLRIGGKWGEEGSENTFNIAGGFGPEHSTASTVASHNAHYDMLGSAWGTWALNDAWDIGWDFTYRTTSPFTAAASSQKGWGGQLYFVNATSDTWTWQARGTIFNDGAAQTDGASTTGAFWGGFAGTSYGGTLGATYAIADDANVKFEYRMDFASTSTAATANADYHTGVVEFGYSF